MKKPFFALVLAAALMPLAAAPTLAQAPPAGPPAFRAQMEQLHATAKTNVFNALSADHRTRVQAIINQVNAGTLDRRGAASQIDAFLSPSESQAILAEGKKMHDAMRQYFAQNPPRGGERMGGPGARGRRGTQAQHERTPDAGRMVVMLGANRRQRPPSQP
ncbi:MAG: hypothetical protein ABR508_08255 [Candidatus Baltobacteraceae bacterium]